MLEHVHLEGRLQQGDEFAKTDGHHGVLVVPHLRCLRRGLFDAQPQRLPLPLAAVVPPGAESEPILRLLDRVLDEQRVVDPLLIHRVEAEHAALVQGAVGTGDAVAELVQAIAVVDGVEKAGDEIQRFVDLKAAHILQ